MSRRSVILSAALFATAGLVLAGCGGEEDGGGAPAAPPPDVTETAPEPAAEPAAEPTPTPPKPVAKAPPKPGPAPPAPTAEPEPEPTPEPEPAAEPETGSKMKHPWSRFGVGSYAAYKGLTVMEVMGNKNEMEMSMKYTLKDITDSAAVVDMEQTAMGNTSSTTVEIPLDQVDMPGPKDGDPIEPKDETITVAGGTFDCKLWEYEQDRGGNKVKTQTWTCDDVPGGLVKMVSVASGQMSSTTTMELTELDAK